jgi:hypothetical protein
MFNGLLKNIAQSILQDGATSFAAWLAVHGYATNADEQGVIGSVVFLGMLAVNAYLQHFQTKPKE